MLLSYLNIAEISYATPSGAFQVLTCRLSSEKPLRENPKGEGDFANAAPIWMKPLSDSCLVTDEGPSEEEEEGAGERFLLAGLTSRLEGSGCVRNCIACQTIRRAEQKKLMNSRSQSEESDEWSARRTYATRCENVPCKNEGSQKFGGRCYACYVVKDPWFGASTGDEQLGNLRVVNRTEDLVCPKEELKVVDSVKDSRKAKDMGDAKRHEDRDVDIEVKDTESSVKVKDTQEPAKFKHRHEPEYAKDKSAKVKGKQESEKVTDRGDPDRVSASTTCSVVLESTKAIDTAKISKCQTCENATRAGDPVKTIDTTETVVVSNTHEPINDQTKPQKVNKTLCKVDEIVSISAPAAITNQSEQLVATGQTPGLEGGSEERQGPTDNKCIVDFCSNVSENAYRGLCRACYQTLARHRAPTDKEVQSEFPMTNKKKSLQDSFVRT